MKTRPGDSSASFIFSLALLAALCAAAGCFNEPEPAYKSVPAANRVYLSGRGLADLSGAGDALAAGAAIDYLNLDRNKLERLDGVEKLTGLKWLRLNENRLAALPDLKALVNLRRIYLRDNKLEEVPGTLKDLPSLTDVDVSGNPIREVPEWLARKEGLKNLSFSRTRLTALPKDLTAWKGLHSLQLGELGLPAAEMARIREALPDVAIAF